MQNDTITEGGLGILLGGLAGFLTAGPIGGIVGAYIGHKAQEMGVGVFLKNTLAIGGGVLVGGALAGPLGAIAGGMGGFSLAKKTKTHSRYGKYDEYDESVNEAVDPKTLKNTFKSLLQNLNLFLKSKSMTNLSETYKSIQKVNNTEVINALPSAQKERLVKIYVFVATLKELGSSEHKEDRIKYEKLLKMGEKDIANTAANFINSK